MEKCTVWLFGRMLCLVYQDAETTFVLIIEKVFLKKFIYAGHTPQHI